MKNITLFVAVLSLTQHLGAQETNSAPAAPPPIPANIDVFSVDTRSPENRQVPFYVRRPAGFDANQPGGPYRILFICPCHNHDGLLTITGNEANQELLDLADQRKWFVVTPTFKHKGNAHDQDNCYYYPKNFSGQAVVDALNQISQKYPVDTNHLLLQGLSGGAQFCHRFAMWAPDRVVAVAINSSSWFDDPIPACNQMAWLVTIGDSDPSFNNTLTFIGKLQDAGATPLFRSFIGMVHEGDHRAVHLDAEFLKFYNDLTRPQLGKAKDVFQTDPSLALQGKDMPFVGDNQTWEYVPNTPDNLAKIDEDSRVFLPSKELADTWGTLKK